MFIKIPSIYRCENAPDSPPGREHTKSKYPSHILESGQPNAERSFARIEQQYGTYFAPHRPEHRSCRMADPKSTFGIGFVAPEFSVKSAH